MRAERCESYHAIDLAWLRRRKMLQPGRSSSIQWSHHGRPSGSIGIVAKANCVHLVYRHRAWGDQWQDMREIVSFTYTQTCGGLGGRRSSGAPTREGCLGIMTRFARSKRSTK